MSKLKTLHLLYSGSQKGGAQRVAIECAMHNPDLYTSTVKSGGLIRLLHERLLRPINFYELIFNYKFDIIFCSDLRALLFSFLCLRSIFSKKYLILHSDQKIKHKQFIAPFCRLLSIDCICTTKVQEDSFKELSVRTSLVRIAAIPVMKPPRPRTNNILYFGRFEKVKNIKEIIDIFVAAKKEIDGLKLILVGSGNDILPNTEGVEIISDWKSQNELEEIMKTCSFVVNATNHEGFSLQIMEGLSNGLFPLVKSTGLIKIYNLPEDCYLNIENMRKATDMNELHWRQFVTNFQRSLLAYLQDTSHLKDYISSKSNC